MRVTFDFATGSEAAFFFDALAKALAQFKTAAVSVAADAAAKIADLGTQTDSKAPTADESSTSSPADQAMTEFLNKESAKPVETLPDGAAATARKPRTRRTASEKAAAIADFAQPPADASAQTTATETTAAEAPTSSVTIDQLREAGNKLMTVKGGNAVLDVLSSFKVRRYGDADASKWPEMLKKLVEAAA